MNTVDVTVLGTDGSETKAKVSRDTMLTDLQNLVGGYIEMVKPHQHRNLNDDEIYIVNEEGLIHNLEPNPLAGGLVGDVVLMQEEDFE